MWSKICLRYIGAALVVVALTAGLTACDKKNSDIIGVWETTNLPDDQYLTFEFSKDGTLTITKPGNGGYGYDYYEAKGTWSRNDDHLYLSYQGQDDVIDARILSVDKNSLVLQQGDDNDGILYLKRIRKSSAKKSIADRKPDTNNTEEDDAAQEDDEDEYAEEEESATNLPTSGYINGHGYVDLGLSVKWATCNVGASSPSDYGNYYAWGETTTKSSYTENNCKTYGKSIGNIAGNANYDAARANWGGTWRMPTDVEINELVRRCQWKWTTMGGHAGYKVTGPNGNSIFLPAAGDCDDRGGTSLDVAGLEDGSYWSATSFAEDDANYASETAYESSTRRAYYLDFRSANFYMDDASRYQGISVRPVSGTIHTSPLEAQVSSPTGTINGHAYVDLGLSVKWATCNVGASSVSEYGNYYAWGETTPKSSYTEENCKTYEKSIGDISGNPQYDAARANWGGTWRMPTNDELYELKKCEYDWVTVGGHSGYKITGPNGNSIFLPAAGERSGSSLNYAGTSGSYWSATPYHEDYLEDGVAAFELTFGSGGFTPFGHGYYGGASYEVGHSVRAVLE